MDREADVCEYTRGVDGMYKDRIVNKWFSYILIIVSLTHSIQHLIIIIALSIIL